MIPASKPGLRQLSPLMAAISATVLAVALCPKAYSGDVTFAPGDVLVSRTTYTGTASTVPFPGLLPNNDPSVADGVFPNVFNNETPDASFGVTSPIVIDRMTITGGFIKTIPVTNLLVNQNGASVTTSFPSKSELGLSVTPDASGVTFAAYSSAANRRSTCPT